MQLECSIGGRLSLISDLSDMISQICLSFTESAEETLHTVTKRLLSCAASAFQNLSKDRTICLLKGFERQNRHKTTFFL